jgi:mannose-6-phosphate isomerase-like protein (cupin superfamily)
MRLIALALLAAAIAPGCAAVQPAAPDPTLTRSAEVQSLIANAKATIKPGQPLMVQPLLTFAPYKANLEYRRAVGSSAIHETDAEFFYVIDGSGTLETGGQLLNAKRTGPHDVGGAGLTGGSARKIAKGDFLVVPEGMPHFFSTIDGTLVLMSMHVPRGQVMGATTWP